MNKQELIAALSVAKKEIKDNKPSLNTLKVLSSIAEKVLNASIEPAPLSQGVDLIAREREEQIFKHGYDLSHDLQNSNEELVKAALYCITKDDTHFPTNWSLMHKTKLDFKSRLESLVIAGAFLAAQVDVLLHMLENDTEKE